jgi:hypothetical protein
LVSHIVFFNPKETLSDRDILAFAQSIQRAMRQIPGISRALIGPSVDLQPSYPRSLGDQTYHYAAILEFPTATELREYLEHPLHREVGRLFWEACESALVVEAELRDVLQEDIANLG